MSKKLGSALGIRFERAAVVIAIVAGALLGGCAGMPRPEAPQVARLLDDAAFKPSSEEISAERLFAISPAMREFVERDMVGLVRNRGARRALIDALYTKGQLQLEYDSTRTRNAAEAFEARSGNCLSLVIMTAAFAKHMQLPVRYQTVDVDETWSRSGDLYFVSTHVNLSLGARLSENRHVLSMADLLTIDFLPQSQLRGQRSNPIDEQTIVAMYMNNRAAESLYAGDIDQAYWWARAAVKEDSRLLVAYNTLGVVYRRHGQHELAERALRHVLTVEPENTQAMSNLIIVLRDVGRETEAVQLVQRLAQLQPHPPYKFFDLGIAAMVNGDYVRARELFSREVARSSYTPEFHFWLAKASFALGDVSSARRQMALALENSTTRKDREIYTAKLDWLKAQRRAQ